MNKHSVRLTFLTFCNQAWSEPWAFYIWGSQFRWAQLWAVPWASWLAAWWVVAQAGCNEPCNSSNQHTDPHRQGDKIREGMSEITEELTHPPIWFLRMFNPRLLCFLFRIHVMTYRFFVLMHSSSRNKLLVAFRCHWFSHFHGLILVGRICCRSWKTTGHP